MTWDESSRPWFAMMVFSQLKVNGLLKSCSSLSTILAEHFGRIAPGTRSGIHLDTLATGPLLSW